MQSSAGCQEALGAGRGEDLEAKLLNASSWGCASGAPCAGDKTPACQGLEEASSEETIAPCCFAHPKEMMLILGILEDWGLLLVLQHIRGCFHGPLHPTILLQTGECIHSNASEASSVMDSISSLGSRKSHPYKSPFSLCSGKRSPAKELCWGSHLVHSALQKPSSPVTTLTAFPVLYHDTR